MQELVDDINKGIGCRGNYGGKTNRNGLRILYLWQSNDLFMLCLSGSSNTRKMLGGNSNCKEHN